MTDSQKPIDILDSYNKYKSVLRSICLDIPIAAMCLPKKIEKKLIKAELHRVSDLASTEIISKIALNESERALVETQVAIFGHEFL